MLEACQIIDHDWVYLYLNSSAEAYHRRPKEEMLGRKVMEVWPGIESTHVFELMRQCMIGRLPVQAETEFTFPDGRQSFIQLSVQPVPEGILIVSTDISERRQTEKSLELFRALIDQSPDAVEVVDPASGRFLDANEMAWQSLGYTRDELLSSTLKDIVNRPILDPAFQQDMQEKGTIVVEALHQRKDGTTFPVELHIRSVQLDLIGLPAQEGGDLQHVHRGRHARTLARVVHVGEHRSFQRVAYLG